MDGTSTQISTQTDLCTKGVFVCFHEKKYLESSDYSSTNIRSLLYKKIHEQLPQHFEPLDSPTISLRTKEEAQTWLQENPLFQIDGHGYRGSIEWDGITKTHNYVFDKSGDAHGWTAPLIGIWASNYIAWKNFLKTDADYLILLEDDLAITEKFSKTIKANVAQLPKNWDVFYQFAPQPLRNRQKFTPIGLKNVCRPWQTWSNAAYLISRKGAQKIVDEIEGGYKIHFPADWIFLCRNHDYELFNMKPWIDQECRLATIQSTHDNVAGKFFFEEYFSD